MHEYPYSTWYPPGSTVRHSLCRSPGMEPAAQSTTSVASDTSLTTPITSAWAGSGWCLVVQAASTVACQSAASSAARSRYAGSADQPARASASASRAARASATTATPDCFAASNDATLTLTNRTPGSANAVREAAVQALHLGPMTITT